MENDYESMETFLKVGVFETHMEIQNIEVMHAHHTNVKQHGATVNGVEKTRPIHAYLLCYNDKVRILKFAARTLKDSQFLFRTMCPGLFAKRVPN